MEWIELPGLFPGLPDPARWLPLLQRHAAFLREHEARARVTSVSPEEAVRRHYAESLEIWRIACEGARAAPEVAVDVGSGGGFPGLVMACVAPAARFALVEPLRKRAALLDGAARTLGLENVTVVAARAEEAARGEWRASAGLVTARAVAALPELLEYTAPFARAGGMLALAKGSGWEAELGGAGNAQQCLGCRFVRRIPMRPAVSETVGVLLFEQVQPSPEKYPRRAGLPHKRPL